MPEERPIKQPSLSPAVVRLGLALALLGLASWSLPIHASPTATITVSTTADELNSDGDCSLREAIQAANTDAAVDACAAGSGADTIVFDAATDGTPIVLTGAPEEDANASGDLDILDGGDLTIQGNGAGITIVDGGGIDRIFHVCPAGGCDNAVTVSGLTIQNGFVRFRGGGGLRNEVGTTTLDASVVIANRAQNGGGIMNFATLHIQNGSMVGQFDAGNSAASGGGIDNWEGGVVTVDGSSVISNTARLSGGGIHNRGTLTVTNGSAIGGNTAAGTRSEDGGGGIYSELGATTTVDGSTLSANACTAVGCDGGGIWNNGTLVVTNGSSIGGTAAGNQATDQGGGIYNLEGSAVVDSSTVSGNASGWGGGGIYNVEAMVTVEGSSVISNVADYGGGIYNAVGTATLDSSTVISNTASNHGGGIYNWGTLNVRNGSGVISNTAAGLGGGIYSREGTVTVDASTVSANTATDGGGIGNGAQGTLTVRDGSIIGSAGAPNHATRLGGGIASGGTATVDASVISANTAGLFGGGIYNIEGAVTVDSSSIISNTATAAGGGIYNRATAGGDGTHDTATLNITNGSAIRGNTASGTELDHGGGGIYNASGATALDASSVISNTAGRSGGAIYNLDGTVAVDSSSIISNTATINGGGIYNRRGTTTVEDSTLNRNAAGYGGGIANSGTLMMDDSTVSGNTSGAGGGGIGNTGTATVNGTGVDFNRATLSGGGIHNLGTLDVHNGSSISGNTAAGTELDDGGGGIYNATLGTTTVTGSRILNNMATANGGGVYNEENVAEATWVTGSCIVGNSDTSFFNHQPAQQIATFNWWGAATGPNSPGADTVGGNVDTSGYLTAPILGCAAELQVSKTNDAGGETTAGTPFHWTLTISNTGMMDAVFGTGQKILVDDLPVGPAYGAPTVADLVDVTGAANIDCGIDENSLTCEAGGGGVTVGTAGRFEVSFSVTAGDAGTLTNPAGICRVDPDGSVPETDENNNCPTDTVIVEVTPRYLYLPLVMRNAGAP
jgi:fibronectin-binding autotransporter adhesin